MSSSRLVRLAAWYIDRAARRQQRSAIMERCIRCQRLVPSWAQTAKGRVCLDCHPVHKRHP